MLFYAGLEQEVRLLMTVVQQVQAVIDACRPHLQWAHQAQQLQQKLQGLQAAVASAEAGAGRSVVTYATSSIKWLGTSLHQAVRPIFELFQVLCLASLLQGHGGVVWSANEAFNLVAFFPPCQKCILHPALGSGQASKHKSQVRSILYIKKQIRLINITSPILHQDQFLVTNSGPGFKS